MVHAHVQSHLQLRARHYRDSLMACGPSSITGCTHALVVLQAWAEHASLCVTAQCCVRPRTFQPAGSCEAVDAMGPPSMKPAWACSGPAAWSLLGAAVSCQLSAQQQHLAACWVDWTALTVQMCAWAAAVMLHLEACVFYAGLPCSGRAAGRAEMFGSGLHAMQAWDSLGGARPPGWPVPPQAGVALVACSVGSLAPRWCTAMCQTPCARCRWHQNTCTPAAA